MGGYSLPGSLLEYTIPITIGFAIGFQARRTTPKQDTSLTRKKCHELMRAQVCIFSSTGRGALFAPTLDRDDMMLDDWAKHIMDDVLIEK